MGFAIAFVRLMPLRRFGLYIFLVFCGDCVKKPEKKQQPPIKVSFTNKQDESKNEEK
jgi:hypothetical protein